MICGKCKYLLVKGDMLEYGLIYVKCPKCGNNLPLGELFITSLKMQLTKDKKRRGVCEKP